MKNSHSEGCIYPNTQNMKKITIMLCKIEVEIENV